MKGILAYIFFLVSLVSYAQESDDKDLEWWFWPNYVLGQNARNEIGPRIDAPESPVIPLKSRSYPFIFFGEEPTQRIEDFYPAERLPLKTFSIEMWMLYHVNQPVGVFSAFRNKYEEADPFWILGLYGQEMVFSLSEKDGRFARSIHHQMEDRGWKDHWIHLVGTFDGAQMNLYVNGEKVSSETCGELISPDDEEYQLEAASYMSKEPYMQLGDLLKCLKIHDKALSQEHVNENFKQFQGLVKAGHIYPDLFHFTAGPYLQMVKHDEISLVWETSEPGKAIIELGTSIPLKESIVINDLALNKETNEFEGTNIHKYTLKELKPDQPYFYNIKMTNEAGETIESGNLTFKTAPIATSTFSYALIGDTEARPHVNSRVAQLLWDERPDFLLNLGDLTDGGKRDNKFQWNYEYFQGMNQFVSRVPVFPVAGNGEGDLYWFNNYHILPENKAYYKFSYGHADFFMLDSNQKHEFAPGEEQYVWLEEQLKQSTARWKFVAHHHAPYSSEENDYGDSWKGETHYGDPDIRKIVPLYEKYGVDIVFFGHLHTYQRTHKIHENHIENEKGVMYVQAGGAGGNLEDFAPTRSWFSAKTFRGHHYVTVEINGSELELRMYDSEGRMKDIFKIEK